jgi:hypothetical protein
MLSRVPRADRCHQPLVNSLAARLSIIAVVIIIAAAVIISYAMDPYLRRNIEHTMNQKLKGYHTSLGYAHLSIWGGVLSLRDLTLIQDAHPSPPVGHIPLLRINIQWSALLKRHIVTDCLILDAAFHIDLIQLKSEATSNVSLRQRGWQDALESIYPFKISRFRGRDADITYIDTDPNRPLHLQQVSFTATNIRNINSPNDPYPSPVAADAIVFGTGHAAIQGKANFLTKPTPSMSINYQLVHVPLAPLEPATRHVNLSVTGGYLNSDGSVEYLPKIERVEVNRADASNVNIEYTHLSATAEAEARHIEEVRETAAKANNAPNLMLKVDRARLNNSTVAYRDEADGSPYRLYLTALNLQASDISNQSSQGISALNLDGLFMGTGETNMTGDFRARKQSPDFDINLTIANTQLASLNDLLRHYGKFDVESGQFSLYSQVSVRDNNISGYVKPFFANLEVYNRNKDKNKPILHQAYELAVGGAAKLLRNDSTKAVATNVTLSGKFKNPNVSTLQALLEVARNAFIKAIVPGFDRQAQEAGGQPS